MTPMIRKTGAAPSWPPSRERGAAPSWPPSREREAAPSWPPSRERGAALLTVLLLVAVIATVSALALERLTLAARLGASANAIEQARLYQLATEQLAVQRVTQVAGNDRTLLSGNWHGRDIAVPIPSGSGSIRVTDGGNCFNLNSLVVGDAAGGGAARPLAISQFTNLMVVLGIDGGTAARIAASSTDWIDTNQTALPGGAEDDAYAAHTSSRRTPDAPMADPGELAMVAGVTPALWARLSPWVCALPTSDLSPITINTLLPEQAPLLQMLVGPRLAAAAARAQITARPATGYASVTAFWTSGALRSLAPPEDAAAQVRIKTRWFRLRSTVRLGDTVVAASSLIDAEGEPVRVVRRAWVSAFEDLGENEE